MSPQGRHDAAQEELVRLRAFADSKSVVGPLLRSKIRRASVEAAVAQHAYYRWTSRLPAGRRQDIIAAEALRVATLPQAGKEAVNDGTNVADTIEKLIKNATLLRSLLESKTMGGDAGALKIEYQARLKELFSDTKQLMGIVSHHKFKRANGVNGLHDNIRGAYKCFRRPVSAEHLTLLSNYTGEARKTLGHADIGKGIDYLMIAAQIARGEI